MKLKLIEPLRDLFKDEVRRIGRDLGMPDDILGRQPFPGPGLAVRILGEVTPERVALLQEADEIVVAEIKAAGLYNKIWQSFAVLLPVMSVGVMGDQRTYAYTCAVRAVHSEDGMTADWTPLPYEVLKRISSRIVNEVRGINRVVYDITVKAPRHHRVGVNAGLLVVTVVIPDEGFPPGLHFAAGRKSAVIHSSRKGGTPGQGPYPRARRVGQVVRDGWRRAPVEGSVSNGEDLGSFRVTFSGFRPTPNYALCHQCN